MAAKADNLTDDAVLGGRLVLRQPRRGHRFGHDAVLLAAATAARSGEHAVDLGAGVGAAGLALASRVAGVAVTLVEIDPVLAALGADNAVRNGLADRVRAVCLDVTAPRDEFAAAGLEPATCAHVLMNPPFNAAPNPSPQPERRLARTAAKETLHRWLIASAQLLRPAGVVTLIWRADGLDALLAALAERFGAVAVLPVHSKPDAPAIRVLARAVKGSRARLALLPGIVLTDASGKPTPEIQAVLRGTAVLALAEI